MIKSIVVSIALLSLPAWAFPADVPASDASIRQLLTAAHAESMLGTMMSQMDAYIKNMVHQMTPTGGMTPKAQAILDRSIERMSASMKETLSWSTMEPMYIRVYRDTFTQTEVDQMTEFYKTPAGQAMVNKMPLVMQNVMREMPTLMKPMLERLQVVQRETAEELRRNAEQEKAAAPAKP